MTCITFKVHRGIFQTLIRHLPRMVQIKKDVIARCLTHKNKCVINLTVGDIVGYFHCIGCMNM